MTTLSDRTTVPLLWLICSVTVALSVGGTAALGLSRATAAAERVAIAEQQIHLLDKRGQRVEDAILVLKDLLAETRSAAAAERKRSAGR